MINKSFLVTPYREVNALKKIDFYSSLLLMAFANASILKIKVILFEYFFGGFQFQDAADYLMLYEIYSFAVPYYGFQP